MRKLHEFGLVTEHGRECKKYTLAAFVGIADALIIIETNAILESLREHAETQCIRIRD